MVPAVSRSARSGTRRTASRVRRAYGISTAIRCRRSAMCTPTIPGRKRADFVLGDRDGTTCAAEFTEPVAKTCLRDMGYSSRSTIRTKESSSCASTAVPPRTGTACKSKSSARCTWTRRRWCRMTAMRSSSRISRPAAGRGARAHPQQDGRVPRAHRSNHLLQQLRFCKDSEARSNPVTRSGQSGSHAHMHGTVRGVEGPLARSTDNNPLRRGRDVPAEL